MEQQEMNLVQWVGTLHSSHRAARQLEELILAAGEFLDNPTTANRHALRRILAELKAR